MSEEDFEAEAKKRGWVKNDTSEATSKGNNCFGDCFGSGSNKKKEARPLETVMEEGDDNFEFRVHTQFQFEEPPRNPGTQETNEPSTTYHTTTAATGWTPVPTATNTPLDTPPITTATNTPMDTPVQTPRRHQG